MGACHAELGKGGVRLPPGANVVSAVHGVNGNEVSGVNGGRSGVSGDGSGVSGVTRKRIGFEGEPRQYIDLVIVDAEETEHGVHKVTMIRMSGVFAACNFEQAETKTVTVTVTEKHTTPATQRTQTTHRITRLEMRHPTAVITALLTVIYTLSKGQEPSLPSSDLLIQLWHLSVEYDVPECTKRCQAKIWSSLTAQSSHAVHITDLIRIANFAQQTQDQKLCIAATNKILESKELHTTDKKDPLHTLEPAVLQIYLRALSHAPQFDFVTKKKADPEDSTLTHCFNWTGQHCSWVPSVGVRKGVMLPQ